MNNSEVQRYLDNTRQTPIRPELEYALGLCANAGVAIDCGCGAGSNIAHLRTRGFSVHAYDIDKQAIALCAERFAGDANVHVSVDSFGTFSYPNASVVVADASLFFCLSHEFSLFIEKVIQSLQPDGLFYGAFLGARDTMASDNFNVDDYWGDVLVFDEQSIKKSLKDFDMLQFKEHESDGVAITGEPHHWHIYSVVARVAQLS